MHDTYDTYDLNPQGEISIRPAIKLSSLATPSLDDVVKSVYNHEEDKIWIQFHNYSRVFHLVAANRHLEIRSKIILGKSDHQKLKTWLSHNYNQAANFLNLSRMMDAPHPFGINSKLYTDYVVMLLKMVVDDFGVVEHVDLRIPGLRHFGSFKVLGQILPAIKSLQLDLTNVGSLTDIYPLASCRNLTTLSFENPQFNSREILDIFPTIKTANGVHIGPPVKGVADGGKNKRTAAPVPPPRTKKIKIDIVECNVPVNNVLG